MGLLIRNPIISRRAPIQQTLINSPMIKWLFMQSHSSIDTKNHRNLECHGTIEIF